MLVKELIYALEQLNPEAKVIAEDTDTVFEVHALAHNDHNAQPIVKLLWLKDVLCHCEACQHEFGELKFAFEEECENCQRDLEEDY